MEPRCTGRGEISHSIQVSQRKLTVDFDGSSAHTPLETRSTYTRTTPVLTTARPSRMVQAYLWPPLA